MGFTVFTSAPLIRRPDGYYAYGPYIREMELWARHTGPIDFACPVLYETAGLLIRIDFPIGRVYETKSFDVKSVSGILRTLLFLPSNVVLLFKAMRNATHIHLRCPGNIGLLACVVQVFFPSKKKTAKYAGNWDPNSKQPLSYKLQKWILKNKTLTRNMKVLVYGKWEGSTKNIVPFFTATYHESDKKHLEILPVSSPIEFVFVGTLSHGKQPLYVVQIVEALIKSGQKCRLRIFGEGALRSSLERYIGANGLGASVVLMGNCDTETVRQSYEESHFMVLPSKSEGWPKVVAEAMFWGCLPISTSVSCVPYMLDFGNRGILLSMDVQTDVSKIRELIGSPEEYVRKTTAAAQWSRQFTLDLFETEIRKLLI